MDTHILVFGTSTTYGAWDVEGGWIQRLRKFLDEKVIAGGYKNYYLVYNLGVSEDKTKDILRRFDAETKARIDENEETIILFHTGINDTIFNQQLNSTETSQERFSNDLKQLIEKAKKYTSKIVLVGFMPVDKRVDPMPWSNGRSYNNKYVKLFNQIMNQVAKETNVHFVEIYEKFINSDYSKLLADGVHMNSQGHEKLYEVVRDYLLKNGILKIKNEN